MKNKIKKWHILLMSFIALFVTICASMFSLRADPIDDETGEILTDNWELGIVFYDSTVNNGTTPLTEINWDASDGGYQEGTPRVITVQINYKNNSAVTTYAPGELEISIPNLIYSSSSKADSAYSASWSSSAIVGANDATHSGYDWTFNSTSAPSSSQEKYSFINANTIEEKSNFEGSIQIQYTIKPYKESPEKYLEQCVHNYNKVLQATLTKTADKILTAERYVNIEHVITSPNWPNDYNNNMTADNNYWEYTSPTSENLVIYFDSTSDTEHGIDNIYIYDKTGNCVYTLSGNQMAGKEYQITGNYVKIAMKSDWSLQKKGFHASITDGELKPTMNVVSNEITMNYTRTYIHPWRKMPYYVYKSASKLQSYDGLPNNADNYTWVKYYFEISGSTSDSLTGSLSYPYIGCGSSLYLTDPLPENCVAYYTNGTAVDIENNQLVIPCSKMTSENYGKRLTQYIFIGYPKEIYNENSNNLSITNTVNLYGTYQTETEVSFLDDASTSLNLANFEFTYTGELYGITKSSFTKQNMSSLASSSYDLMWQSIRDNDGYNYVQWQVYPTVYYTGTPLTVRVGDDLLYSTTEDGGYEKLDDSDYYFSYLYIPAIYNRNNQVIPAGTYDLTLFVRYENTNEYVQYGNSFKNHANRNTAYSYSVYSDQWIEFKEDEKVVGWYIQIDDMHEGISSFVVKSRMMFVKENIPQSGTLYNFAYLKVFSKDSSGNLTLLNNVDESTYANFITKDLIATYDINNHGGYIQRAVNNQNWAYYNIFDFTPTQRVSKGNAVTVTQDAENEQFTGKFSITGTFTTTDIDGQPTTKVFVEQVKDEDFQSNMILYDLLPEGMLLTSTEEEILNSLQADGYYGNFYDLDRKQAFSSTDEMKEFLLSHTTVTITDNWNNTGRTRLKINIDFPDRPLLFRGTTKISTTSAVASYPLTVKFTYGYSIPYDEFLEKGNVWKNYVYLQSTNSNVNINIPYNNAIQDNGQYDKDAADITENNSTEDIVTHSSASVTINSIISTHQDVTAFVKTNHNHYMTGTADSDCNTEYEYKLRVRTGAADVTNLILYTNIEEAQPERQRWKGEFLGIDTSYAESKGYTVKPYYSENPKAGNLYNEDGTLNSDWKEYTYDTPAIYAQGLELKFNSQCLMEYATYDYVEIYYILNGTTYKLGKWGGTELAGKTIQIPTNDFYLYWHTDGSACSYYGFSIDSITHKKIENTNTTKGTIPSYGVTEIQGDAYPDSEFGSYTHGNYGDNVNKIWHYTYTGEKELIQETIQGTDKTKVKSLAFKYLDSEDNPAIVPANSITYVLINMKSPSDESIRTLARMDCWTQWNALDEFDRPVDFITGINSNVVKVALPNSVDEDNLPSISLKFRKEIQGTDSQFENMKLDKAEQQLFMLRLTDLTANEDGSYNQITALLKSDQELIISRIPIGTYLLEELGDNYFDFVEFVENNEEDIIIEGVTFERTDQGYIITVSEDLAETVEFNIKVTNEIEPERFYEDKDNKENLFLKNKIEENS